MNSWLLTQQVKSSQKRVSSQSQQLRHTEIDNYYGAHKNFKTDFRNKKYKNVYMQLIHRKPAQSEHKVLYYQDILISIIKSLEISFLGKEGHIGPVQPFFHFGTKAITEFYWLFLVQRRIIDQEMAIDPSMRNKISNFLTLIIDFCCKVSTYLCSHGNLLNSQKIFRECYQSLVKCVINSSTSNLLLLKKCGQFLLQYATFCLKTQKYSQAHELLKDGLKNQLNQLILLKYDIKRKRNYKKNLKRYTSTLKTLTHFYINLGLYYEKENKMYQCATVILDAVLIEQLITIYKAKTKKWVCGLEQSYLEQKNKYLEITRICNRYFEPNFLIELSHEAKRVKKVLAQTVPHKFHSKNKKSIKSNGTDTIFFYQNNYQEIREGQEREKGKMRTKTSNDHSVKEVRFKLNQEIISQTKSETNTVKMSEKKMSETFRSNWDIFKQSKVDEGEKKECQSIKNATSYKDMNQEEGPDREKQKAIQLTSKNIQSIENNQFLLFGESFWQSKKGTARSKSTFQKLQDRHELEIKKTRRKLSYNNISYLEANSLKSKLGMKNKRSYKYLKQNYLQKGTLRKRPNRDRGLFLQKCEQNPDSIQVVEKKILEWHRNSSKIETDLSNKVGRLRQKKNAKNGLEISEVIECIETERQSSENKQKSITLIQQELQAKRSEEISMKKNKKQSCISVFKKFLTDHKAFFNISKVELLTSPTDPESQKRYLSFLIAEKPQKIQKYIQKNHWQAKSNIQYFMNQIEQSNKKLKKSLSKSHKKTDKKSLEPTLTQSYQIQAQRLPNMQTPPSNLFGTSLKSRAQQLVKLL